MFVAQLVIRLLLFGFESCGFCLMKFLCLVSAYYTESQYRETVPTGKGLSRRTHGTSDNLSSTDSSSKAFAMSWPARSQFHYDNNIFICATSTTSSTPDCMAPARSTSALKIPILEFSTMQVSHLE